MSSKKRKEKVREIKGELRIMTKVAGRKRKRRTKIYIILILYR